MIPGRPIKPYKHPKRWLSDKHVIAFLFLLLSGAGKLIAQPSITSFSPASGPVGITVTITGSGFSASPSDNIVFFGAVKASVTAASSNTLSVVVPAGATFQPITVTVNKLTAYSALPFIITFTGGGSIDQQSFGVTAAADSVPNTIFETRDLNFADFDGDGKTDAAVIDGRNDLISIYRNTTSNKKTSFAIRQDIITTHSPGALTIGDMDGDGRPDLVISNTLTYTISIFRNTSTPGSISFAARSEIPMRSGGGDIKVSDLDGDGRPDIAMLNIDLDSINGLRSLLSIFRNNSSAGVITFEGQKDISLGFLTTQLCIGNLDNDSRPEIAISSFLSNRLLVLKNNSNSGQISFSAGPLLETRNTPVSLAMGDLDMDGKQDLVSANIEGNTVSLFRNLTSGGTLAFAPKLDLNAGVKVSDVEISDLDGDGKPDLAVCDLGEAIVLLRNLSSVGSFSFAYRVSMVTNFADDFSIADVNNDGQPDLGVISGFYRVLFWENRIGFPLISYFLPLEAARGDTIRINGTHFTNATSVMIGGQAALSYQVISPTSITAVVGSAVSGDVVVTTPRGSHSKSGFIFKGPPIITGFTPTEGGRGKPITITGHNFTGTSAVKFGGVHANSFEVVSPDKILAFVNYGASGAIEVTNRFGTASIDGFIFLPVPVINSFSPAAAASGTTVTIRGKFLTMTEEVKFDMYRAASFAVINDSTITAVVGKGGSGSITVSTRGGSATIAGFNVLPGITSFTPTAAAMGDTVTIRGTNLWNVSSLYFGAGWTFSMIRISDTVMKAIVEDDATSGNVTLNSTHGSTTLPGFTFIPRPVITAVSPLLGGRGTIVTITGMNYENVYSVTFGSVPAAKFTVVSSTSIQAEIGDSASGLVTVKSRGGTSVHKTATQYTYHYFHYTTVPVINHFSPSAAAVGTEITITGANFDPVAANNIVYFGTVRSTVTYATMNTLKVLVPSGASYHERITVTTKNLTGYSGKPFVVTFKGDTSLTAATFSNFINIPTGKSPAYITSGDLDNDGKTDLIAANSGSNTISILRNIGTNGEIRFAPKMDVVVGEGPYLLRAADIDGDGKLEILSFTYGSAGYKAQILPNTTNNGTISFGEAVEWEPGWHPKELAIGDVDNDGKPDIMIVNTNSRFSDGVYLRVFLNGSTPGNIIRKSYPHYLGLSRPYTGLDDRFLNSIAVGDLNEDGKLDIAVGYSRDYYENLFTIYSVGLRDNLIDVEGTDYTHQRNVLMGDFDVDGKLDIIDEKNVFRHKQHFSFEYDKVSVVGDKSVLADISGDGKVDVLTLRPFAVSVFRNTSIPGAASFNQKFDFATGALTSSMIAGDFDGDGRPDIAVTNLNDNTISILKNQSGSGILKICEGTGTLINANLVGNTYQWQVNQGNGFVNIINNSNYSGSNTNRLQLINIPVAFNSYLFRCLVDGAASQTFTLEVVAMRSPVVSITSSANNICSNTPVTFTASTSHIGTAPVFKWFVNDSNANVYGSNNVYTAYLKNNNDRVRVELTSNAACIINPIVTSNIIVNSVTPSVTASATITSAASNTICEGTPVTFNAAITNGGSAPSYQWQLNGVNTGITGNSFTTSALKNNDRVKLVVTSNAVCVTTALVNSNEITVSILDKPVGKATAPANICSNQSYTVTYNSANTAVGSQVELRHSLNGNAFTPVASRTYNGTALEFLLNSGSSNATGKYYFSISPPANTTCATLTNSDTVTVATSTLLKPVIAVNVDSITVINADPAATYYWQELISGSWIDAGYGRQKQSVKMYSTGSFRVRAEKGGCTEISESLAVMVTGLPDLTGNTAGIKLRPNPTHGMLTLDSLLLTDKWETVDIMSADGTNKFATFNIRNRTSLTIHLESLSQGLYLAVFKRRNQKPVSIKFLKM